VAALAPIEAVWDWLLPSDLSVIDWPDASLK
jgi:hypothetical protein